jgi:phenylalanyl-tRNA synthetase beta subunit
MEAVKRFRTDFDGQDQGVKLRLASGNVGLMAAINEEVEQREIAMMLYVYAAIVGLVLLAYRDWRAMLACCLPLTLATFLGYWFMKSLDIGLTVATLPVMVLATGIGVDYAFYIYSRLQINLAQGQEIALAIMNALQEVGIATVFTALTLAIGVATWSFSELKFQADMGKLLAFMFIVNLVMAMTALPALASVLERWFPRRKPARAPGQMQRKPILVVSGYFNGFLGTSFSADEMKQALLGLGCSVQTNDSGWSVVPPSFRLDLNQPEDLAEEVARSLGYDRIPATIPPLTGMPTLRSQDAGMARWALAERAKDAWVQNGFSETVNFAFTQPAWLEQLGLKSEAKLLNPLSEELSVLVPSLLPGLIRNALDSWNHHFGAEKLPIRLFELRPTFHTQGPVEARGEMETSLIERWKLAVALSGPRQAQALRGELGEVDFFDLKAAFESTFEALGARGVRFLPLSQSRSGGNPLLHPGQSVEVLAGNQVAGSFGLLHPKLARILKVRAPLYLGELDWEVLQKLCRPVSEGRPFKAISQFPGIERDFALVVKSDIPAEKVTQIALKAGRPLAKSAQVFDIYRGSQVAEGMTSVAVRVTFLEEGRSPQEAEAENSAKAILDAWKKELGAELR